MKDLQKLKKELPKQDQSKNLEILKIQRRIFGKESSEQEKIYILCEIMQICGGYEQLKEISLPTLKHIIRYLEYINKQIEKNIPRMPHIK